MTNSTFKVNKTQTKLIKNNLLITFGYISTISFFFVPENYGQAGIQAFRELAERSDVCIAKEDSVLSNADDEDFDDVIRNLVQDTSAQVVVCFCEGMTVRGLLQATKRLNYTGRLLFIGR